MTKSSSDNPGVKRDQREKATIDHLVDKVFDPDSAEKHQQPPTTESGTPVEEQVRGVAQVILKRGRVGVDPDITGILRIENAQWVGV